MAYCSKCGAKVSVDAAFCSACGADLAEFPPEDTFAPPVSVPKVTLPKLSLPKVTLPSFSIPTINWKPVALSVVAILIVGAVGMVASQFFISEEGEETASRETPSTLTLTMTPELDDLPFELGTFSEGLFVIKDGSNYGYADERGEIVVPPTFAIAYPFKDGVALVGEANQDLSGFELQRAVRRAFGGNRDGVVSFRYIDKTGAVLGDRSYLQVQQFSEGLAAVRIGELWGYINRSGQFAIEPQYAHAKAFSEGVAVVGKLGTGPIVIDQTGERLFDIGNYRAEYFSGGLIQIDMGNPDSGYLNKNGERVINFGLKEHWPNDPGTGEYLNYLAYGYFSDGRAAYKDRNRPLNNNLSHRCGYIDETGNVAISPTFSDCTEFRGGLAAVGTGTHVRNQGTWSFINTSGENTSGQKYGSIRPMFLNPRSVFDGISKDRRDDHWIIEQGGRFGAMSADGNLIEPQYDRIVSITHGLYAVVRDGKVGVVNTKGEMLIEPQFDTVGRFSDGRALVRIDGKYGFISG